MFRGSRYAFLFLVLVAAPACQGKPAIGSNSTTVADVAVGRAIDSCYTFQPGPDTSRGAVDSARSARRLTGRTRDFDGFSLFVPDGATAATGPGTMSLSGWPSCSDCRFGVTLQPDSGVSLEQRMAARVAEQKRIDSVNADPKSAVGEFDDLFGPPKPISGRAGKGYEIDNGCGDCVSITRHFARPPVIAQISYGFDDNTAMPWRHRCEMDAVAGSFVFRD